MRRITMLALVAVLALLAAACGGDDDDAGGDTDSGSTTTTTEPESDDGGGDGTDTAAGFLDEDCQFLLAGAYLNPLAALAPGGAGEELDETSTQLEAIAEEAPEEIQDAMEVLADGYAAMLDALGDVDFSDPQSFADPEVQQKIDELEDVFDETYEEAGETVSTYIQENCGAG